MNADEVERVRRLILERGLAAATDEQLRNEWYRRHPDTYLPRMAVLPQVTDDELLDELQRRAPNRPAMLKVLANDELRAECERRFGPRQSAWPQPRIGELVSNVAAASSDVAACDVIDQQLFQERLADVEGLRGGRKLAADIRGVVIAACREREEWKRLHDIEVGRRQRAEKQSDEPKQRGRYLLEDPHGDRTDFPCRDCGGVHHGTHRPRDCGAPPLITVDTTAAQWPDSVEVGGVVFKAKAFEDSRTRHGLAESGGSAVAALPPDEGHYIDPLDLLADDE